MFFLSSLTEKDIFVDVPFNDFNSIIFHMVQTSHFSRKREAFEATIEREAIEATSIGHDISIPHCRLKNFKGFFVKLAVFKQGAGYKSSSGQDVRIVLLVVGSQEDISFYLKSIAHAVKILRSKELRNKLFKASGKKEMKNIINQFENKELEL